MKSKQKYKSKQHMKYDPPCNVHFCIKVLSIVFIVDIVVSRVSFFIFINYTFHQKVSNYFLHQRKLRNQMIKV